jgi:hypothetical protein
LAFQRSVLQEKVDIQHLSRHFAISAAHAIKEVSEAARGIASRLAASINLLLLLLLPPATPALCLT